MINIIICDDNKKDLTRISKIVKSFFNNIEYKLHLFNDYDDNFNFIVNSNLENKIYILDIEVNERSGIDAARYIRNKDYKSYIIFLSGHDDLTRIISKKNIMCFNFINKFDDTESNLNDTLNRIVLNINNNNEIVKIKVNNTIYNINTNKIYYITKETISRKTLIYYDNLVLSIKISMRDLLNKLNIDLVQTHKACFVNDKYVIEYNVKDKYILFDNNTKIDLISKKYMKDVIC